MGCEVRRTEQLLREILGDAELVIDTLSMLRLILMCK
jgi:hypothetical protein